MTQVNALKKDDLLVGKTKKIPLPINAVGTTDPLADSAGTGKGSPRADSSAAVNIGGTVKPAPIEAEAPMIGAVGSGNLGIDALGPDSGARTAAKPAVPSIGSGFAKVDGKKIDYQDIGGIADPFKVGYDGSGRVKGQAENSLSIVGNLTKSRESAIPSIGELSPDSGLDGAKGNTVPSIGNTTPLSKVAPGKISGIGAPVSNAEYRDQVAHAIRFNAANGFAPTTEQLKTTGMGNTDLVNLLSSHNKGGRYDKQIADLQAQQGLELDEKKLANEVKATEGDLAFKRESLALDTPLKTAQAKNFQSEAEYRDWLRTPEGIAHGRDGKELPADARMVEYLTNNGIAADPKQAWSMLKTAKVDPVGVVSSLVGDMEARQEKLGILPTDPRFKDRDTLVSEASDLIRRVQGAYGEDGPVIDESASSSIRDVAPLRDFFSRNSKHPISELLDSALRQGWSESEIREARRPASSSSRNKAARSHTETSKATLNGNEVVFEGERYPLNADGTVTINGRKHRVQL